MTNKELDNINLVDRISRIHGLMAVTRLSYNEAERLLEVAERTRRNTIDIWAEELVEKTRRPKSNVV